MCVCVCVYMCIRIYYLYILYIINIQIFYDTQNEICIFFDSVIVFHFNPISLNHHDIVHSS